VWNGLLEVLHLAERDINVALSAEISSGKEVKTAKELYRLTSEPHLPDFKGGWP
jgi:hypothetical protein